MKLDRSQDDSIDPIGSLFEDFDSFLTDLIVERAPAADRGSLNACLAAEGKPARGKARGLKAKVTFGQAA